MVELNNNEMEINLTEYIKLMWQKKWLIIGLFVIAVVGAVLAVRQMDPIYQTSATIMIQKNDGMQNLFAGDMFSLGKDNVSTYSLMIKTRTMLNQVIDKMGLKDEKGTRLSSAALAGKITVRPINGTDLIEISLQDKDPVKAKDIVNILVETFQEANVKMNKATLMGALEFIDKQKVQTERDLKLAEDELLNYKMFNKVVSPTDEAKQSLAQLVDIEKLKSMAEIELSSAESGIQLLREELQKHSEKLISATIISSNPLVRQYKGQITELETNLVGMKAKFTSNHPEVVSLEEKITNIEDALSKEVEKEISSETTSVNPIYQSLYKDIVTLEATRLASEAKIVGYNNLLTKMEQEIAELPVKELELIRLERKAKVTGEIYTMLMTKAEELKISEALETSGVYLVDSAYLPRVPIKPNKKVIVAISGIFSIMIGIMIIFLWNYFDNTVKSAEEIERMFNLPVLGSIPDISKVKNMKKAK